MHPQAQTVCTLNQYVILLGECKALRGEREQAEYATSCKWMMKWPLYSICPWGSRYRDIFGITAEIDMFSVWVSNGNRGGTGPRSILLSSDTASVVWVMWTADEFSWPWMEMETWERLIFSHLRVENSHLVFQPLLFKQFGVALLSFFIRTHQQFSLNPGGPFVDLLSGMSFVTRTLIRSSLLRLCSLCSVKRLMFQLCLAEMIITVCHRPFAEQQMLMTDR